VLFQPLSCHSDYTYKTVTLRTLQLEGTACQGPVCKRPCRASLGSIQAQLRQDSNGTAAVKCANTLEAMA
jgi:hypothetical protein